MQKPMENIQLKVDSGQNKNGSRTENMSPNIEKRLSEELQGNLVEIETEMRNQGLESDAEIVKKTQERFEIYVQEARKRKDDFEKIFLAQQYPGENRKTMISKLQDLSEQYTIAPSLRIAVEIGNGGGEINAPNQMGGHFRREDFTEEKFKEMFEQEQGRVQIEKHRGAEILNSYFSKAGEELFIKKFNELNKNTDKNDIRLFVEKPEEGMKDRKLMTLFFGDTFLDSLDK